MEYPKIIQGGMGIAVSSWQLASAVARRGQMGVVSATGMDLVFSRRLQLGDIGGHFRNALDHFPIPEMAERVWNRYFIEGGKAPDAPYKSKPTPNVNFSKALGELIVVANFCEVFLAKQGHSGKIGINLLEKIQVPTIPSLFGAMLAGVDYVLMGAGIPWAIPGILNQLAALENAEHRMSVTGAAADEFAVRFDPKEYCPATFTSVKRPDFLAIVSSATLAQSLARKPSSRPDGFVVETSTAGGHNAPPRGPVNLNEQGEPIYGERDIPDLKQFCELGLPFWMAGSYGTAEGLRSALENGAKGIQVGTAFAFCNESGLLPDIKAKIIQMSREGKAKVYTDPKASPTGFPFKVVGMEGTLSEVSVYKKRQRICDLGYLRELYKDERGKLSYRCCSEPVDDLLRKGGDEDGASGRKCLCNGLLSTIGLGQVRDGEMEPAIITAGDDVSDVARFAKPGQNSYSADDVLEALLCEQVVHA